MLKEKQQKPARSIYSPDDVFPVPGGVRASKRSILGWGGVKDRQKEGSSAPKTVIKRRTSVYEHKEQHFCAYVK